MRSPVFQRSLLILSVSLTPGLAAQPSALIGNAGDFSYLARYDLATGLASETVFTDMGMTALAFSPGGELFGVIPVSEGGPEPFVTPWLAAIDLEARSVELRGPVGPTAILRPEVGLAFDATGRLWMTDREGRLFRLNPETGAAEERAAFGRPVYGLTACGTTLFGLTTPTGASSPVQLLRIDPESGSSVVLGSGAPGVFMNEGGGLDFGPDGRLWAVLKNMSGIPGPLLDFIVVFDPATGTMLESQLYQELGRGLAIAPPPTVCPGRGVTEVPAAGSVGLAALAALLALGALSRLRARTVSVAKKDQR